MYRRFIKRFLDFIISLFGLLLLSPILLLIALLLVIANQGNVFFTQERPGRREKIFRVIKFRSMNNKRDIEGNLLLDSERLTHIGKFIRATSLDELPQLINVLKGNMSLIGPRPLLIRYLPFYSEREKLRHSILPGITGLAQVSGRNTLDWDSKLELDVRYAENITFMGDIKILWATLTKVVNRDGAIPDKKENYFDIERQNKLML